MRAQTCKDDEMSCKPPSLLVAFLLLACNTPSADSSASGAPPTARSPHAGSVSASCMTAAESQKNAKPHRNAEPPYADCAAGVFAHCGPDEAYCGLMLDVKATAEARKKAPDQCCYPGAD